MKDEEKRKQKEPSIGAGFGPSAGIPGVTETTNAQGNRSFSGHRQAPSTPKPGMPSGQDVMVGVDQVPRWNMTGDTSERASRQVTPNVDVRKSMSPDLQGTENLPRWSQFGDNGLRLSQQPDLNWDTNNRTKAAQPTESNQSTNPFAGKKAPTGKELDALNTQLGFIASQERKPAAKVPAKTATAKPATEANAVSENTAGAGFPGVTETKTEDGRRSFTGRGGVGPDYVQSMDMGITDAQRTGRSGVANPGFEKALAAGDYENALQTVNRSDVGQMERLGQLQGQLRQQRDQDAAEAAARNYGTDKAADVTAQRMLRQAEELAGQGFSRGASRLVDASQSLKGKGRGSKSDVTAAQGFNPEAVKGYDEMRSNQADADVAEAQAAQARTNQQQQGVLQGLIDQINNPETSDEQRRSLIDRYQSLSGDKGASYESRVVDTYDANGYPTGQTLYTINQRTGDAQAVNQPQQAASQYQMGAIYNGQNGQRARFAGYDANGNPQWEAVE